MNEKLPEELINYQTSPSKNFNNFTYSKINTNTISFFNDENSQNDELSILKLFVGGLNYVTMRADLKSYFETYGKVISCTVVYTPKGKSKCYGFVILNLKDYKNVYVKEKILFRRHEINGKVVDVKLYEDNKENRNLYSSYHKENLYYLFNNNSIEYTLIHNYDKDSYLNRKRALSTSRKLKKKDTSF